MENNPAHQINMTAEAVFDPPDAEPGWYIIVWVQVGNSPRYGMRYGPIEAQHLEAARQELYDSHKSIIDNGILELKRSMRIAEESGGKYRLPGFTLPHQKPGLYGRRDELQRFSLFASADKFMGNMLGVDVFTNNDVPPDEIWVRSFDGIKRVFRLGDKPINAARTYATEAAYFEQFRGDEKEE